MKLVLISEHDDDDEEWQPGTWQKHVMKPKTLSLTLPRAKIPSLLADTSTTTRTSIRNEMKITSTLISAGGGSIDDVSQSPATIFRQRKTTIKKNAVSMRKELISEQDSNRLLLVHYDGQIIKAFMEGIVCSLVSLFVAIVIVQVIKFIVSNLVELPVWQIV